MRISGHFRTEAGTLVTESWLHTNNFVMQRTVPTDGWDVYNEQGSSESSGAQLLMFQKVVF